jgi:hypothetical protein
VISDPFVLLARTDKCFLDASATPALSAHLLPRQYSPKRRVNLYCSRVGLCAEYARLNVHTFAFSS